MRKRIMFTTISAITASALSFILVDKQKRETLFKKLGFVQDKHSERMPIEKAGRPEQSDNHENAKMVDEGSQFGIKYYQNLKYD